MACGVDIVVLKEPRVQDRVVADKLGSFKSGSRRKRVGVDPER